MREKTDAITELLPPTNVHEVQQLMGMFNYYRKFVPNFAEIAKGIIKLTKKGVKFEWTQERQVAFDMLKDYLTKSPIPIYLDPNKAYYLFTDASKFMWSAILMQEHSTQEDDGQICTQLHPITFQSGTFKGSQLNWATLKKEAYAIYMAFRKFSYYLEGTTTNTKKKESPFKK